METVKYQKNKAFSDELKERMESISIAFESFDLEGFRKQVLAIRELSRNTENTDLSEFCSEFLNDMDKEGFGGIYKKIRSFIDLATDAINEADRMQT